MAPLSPGIPQDQGLTRMPSLHQQASWDEGTRMDPKLSFIVTHPTYIKISIWDPFLTEVHT